MFGFFSKKKPAKGGATKPAKSATPKPTTQKPAAQADAASATPSAKAKPAPSKPAPPKPEAPVSAGSNLDRAKSALEKRAGPVDRQKLIQQALAVHQTQSKKLDSLPQETRQRLQAMALKAFVLGDKDKKKLN